MWRLRDGAWWGDGGGMGAVGWGMEPADIIDECAILFSCVRM
jgi:hypothetical protein